MEFVSTIEKTKMDYLQRGQEQGIAQGMQQGREQGMILAYRRAIVQLAQGRGLELSDASIERVDACTSTEKLEAWHALVGITEESPVHLS